MAKAILDLFIEQGYPYEMSISLDSAEGVDLEADYACHLYSESMGTFLFSTSAGGDRWELTLSKENTDLLDNNLEEYSVYTIKIADGSYDKLLSGRIHVDRKVRA